MDPTAAAYDEVPYFSKPFAEANPDRLASMATLFGLQPAPIENARVLELGCAGGGHLIPLASLFPDAQFTGIDLSAEQIGVGQERVRALGLENLNLECMSLTDVDASFGEFDYVIGHGLFSWVPEPVREAIFALCQANLAPHGVAYLSFNTLPGWSFQRQLREMMLFHTRELTDPAERVKESRSFLRFLIDGVPADSHYGMQLRAQANILFHTPDYHLLHDHLADANTSFYLHEFMARASAHGLQYLGDADLWTMSTARFPPSVRAVIETIPDPAVREQYMDFAGYRSFRRALLVRSEAMLDRGLTPARLGGLQVWTEAKIEPPTADPNDAAPLELSDENVTARITDPMVKAALLAMRDAPQGLPAEDVPRLARERLGGQPAADDEGRVLSFLLSNVVAGTVKMGRYRRPFATDPGERPQAPAFVRLAAAKGDPSIPTLRHTSTTVDEFERRVLALLDGSRGRAQLLAELTPQPSGADLDAALSALAAKALLSDSATT